MKATRKCTACNEKMPERKAARGIGCVTERGHSSGFWKERGFDPERLDRMAGQWRGRHGIAMREAGAEHPRSQAGEASAAPVDADPCGC